MEDNNKGKAPQAPIDIVKLFGKIWAAKKLYMIVLPAVLVVTYLVTLCVPRYYSCTMELAPETSDGSGSSALGSIASSFGLGNLGKLAGNNDAINPLLYPDLLKSPDFIVSLLSIQVTTKEGETYSYYDYLDKHQKAAVWDQYIISPIHNLFVKEEPSGPLPKDTKLDVRHLTKRQDEIIGSVSGKFKCVVDKKTDAITITVQDQDAEVCATIGDSVLSRMQQFIVDYRTKKARNDYNHYKKLLADAKVAYDNAVGTSAYYSDSHRNAIDQSIIAKTEDNTKQVGLKYQTYSAIAVQLQVAEAKIQENTPAFTVIKSATLPHKPAGPKRVLISLAMTIFAMFVMTIYIVFKK